MYFDNSTPIRLNDALFEEFFASVSLSCSGTLGLSCGLLLGLSCGLSCGLTLGLSC